VETTLAAAPMVIYVHGGGWHEGDRGAAMHPWLNPFLVSHGYVTASVTYRLSGEARWPAPLDDVRTALRWLREHAEELGADATRIGLWGHSAGAHLAAMAALTATADESVQAVALSACPADLRTRPLGTSDVVTWLSGPNPATADLGAASPLCHVHAGAPPFLLAHGTQDGVVPFENSERLRDALDAAGAETTWVPVEHADHDWADLPATRGRGEATGSFGSVALPFFGTYLRHPR
jgi:acetyl esterase/lipase